MNHEELIKLKDRLDLRLNNTLIEMDEGWDDSIIGFNDAWDVVRRFFEDLLKEYP